MPDNPHQQEIDLLLQKEWRKRVIPQLGQNPNDPWITVYQDRDNEEKVSLAISSVLILNRYVESLLQTPEWGGHVHELRPGFTGGSEDSTPVYHRFVGSEYSIEPFVILRSFHGLKPDTVDILEEFRLYHNLYEDRQISKLVRFDAGGSAVDVVKIADGLVQVSRKELRQFLAARDLSLAVFFDRRYHAGRILEVIESERVSSLNHEHFVYRFNAFDHRKIDDGTPETYSRLLGKKVIAGFSREKCGIWPYDKEPIHELERFIIGTDENEDDILAYSSPYSYGAATTDLDLPEGYQVPEYLTPVFFDRRVLKRYSDEPSKYRVYDGYLQCGEKWGLQIDNNNPNFVIVWLGDLGRDLPHTEHKHWKGYNVRPDGRMSKSHLRSQLPSTVEEALDPGVPEDRSLRFKRAKRNLVTAWNEEFGWSLFKPLRSSDNYHCSKMRLPSTREISELLDIMLSLCVATNDSIDTRKLKREIPGFQTKDITGETKLGITVLEEFLVDRKLEDTDKYVRCLRTVQDLRSAGAAHRKGKKYRKVAKAVGLDTKTTQQVANEIFTTLTEFLDSLREHFCAEETA